MNLIHRCFGWNKQKQGLKITLLSAFRIWWRVTWCTLSVKRWRCWKNRLRNWLRETLNWSRKTTCWRTWPVRSSSHSSRRKSRAALRRRPCRERSRPPRRPNSLHRTQARRRSTQRKFLLRATSGSRCKGNGLNKHASHILDWRSLHTFQNLTNVVLRWFIQWQSSWLRRDVAKIHGMWLSGRKQS